jgi:hypothetical protein
MTITVLPDNLEYSKLRKKFIILPVTLTNGDRVKFQWVYTRAALHPSIPRYTPGEHGAAYHEYYADEEVTWLKLGGAE